jgi:structural maintenance of chromosome 3 (chondroitin sulfate proteoglycan 6)
LCCGVERTCLTLSTFCLQDEQKALETLMSKRSALQGKRTELERKIKDLGSLPSEAFEKWRDHSLQELHKLLQKANTQLKKFRCG